MTAPAPRRTRSRARSASASTGSITTSNSSAATCTRRRCSPAARATTSCSPTATRSSAGAKSRTSPNTVPPGQNAVRRAHPLTGAVLSRLSLRLERHARGATVAGRALERSGAAMTLYASWNGATGVSGWTVARVAEPGLAVRARDRPGDWLRDGHRARQRRRVLRRAGARRRRAGAGSVGRRQLRRARASSAASASTSCWPSTTLRAVKAVILAGGLGSRLSEETAVRPKPMVEIGGKPILWHIMKIYAAHGDRGLRDLPRLQGLRDQGVLRQLLPAHVRRHLRPRRGRRWRCTARRPSRGG